jgi:SRSO17 transposase
LSRGRRIFCAGRSDGLKRAQEYVSGLLVADRGNMLRMEEAVPGADEQVLQHFLSESKWDERAVLSQVAQDVDARVGGHSDTCLILDESGFQKKGDLSVGVARQWCGRLGKIENCQVAVFSILNRRDRSAPIGVRLYLPKSWIHDRPRCRRAGIPMSERRRLRTKHELALELVDEAIGAGARYRWVGCDAGYGKNPEFLRALCQRKQTFVADVHKDQIVFLQNPTAAGGASARELRVDTWAQGRPASAWKRVAVRETTKGTLEVDILHQVVWLWNRKEETAHEWRLLVRREVASPEKVTYTLSNAGPHVTARELAQMQAQRYWVERTFQDAKTEAGLDEYQVRGWTPWHRHVALVCMALAFLLGQRLENRSEYPLLSCRDITALLTQAIRGRGLTEDALLRQMERRHRARKRSIDAAYRRQRVSRGS